VTKPRSKIKTQGRIRSKPCACQRRWRAASKQWRTQLDGPTDKTVLCTACTWRDKQVPKNLVHTKAQMNCICMHAEDCNSRTTKGLPHTMFDCMDRSSRVVRYDLCLLLKSSTLADVNSPVPPWQAKLTRLPKAPTPPSGSAKICYLKALLR
jgi:hypothetical protein